MISIPTLAWLTVAFGIVFSFMYGLRAPKGAGVLIGILFIDLVLGFGLTYVLTYLSGACIKIGWCQETDDHSVWLLALPILAIPAYLIATLIGKGIGMTDNTATSNVQAEERSEK